MVPTLSNILKEYRGLSPPEQENPPSFILCTVL